MTRAIALVVLALSACLPHIDAIPDDASLHGIDAPDVGTDAVEIARDTLDVGTDATDVGPDAFDAQIDSDVTVVEAGDVFVNDAMGCSGSCGPPMALAAGAAHTCVVTITNRVYCWGSNASGQLGNPLVTGASSVPVAVVGLPVGFTPDAIVASDTATCAYDTMSSMIFCWGANDRGQIGAGHMAGPVPPTAVGLPSGVPTIDSVVAGSNHFCAVVGPSGGTTVYCWGANNLGQVGDGVRSDEFTPQAIAIPWTSGATTNIAAGGDTTCATNDAELACWGDNASDQAGQSGGGSFATPMLGTPAAPYVFLAMGVGFSCGEAVGGGAMYCWGSDADGAFGDSDAGAAVSPTGQAVPGLTSIGSMGAGGGEVCAANYVVSGGTFVLGGIYCWGADTRGQIGNGTIAPSVSTITEVVPPTHTPGGFAIGAAHMCEIETSGTQLFCWGANDSGQLGNGMSTDSSVPVEVTGF